MKGNVPRSGEGRICLVTVQWCEPSARWLGPGKVLGVGWPMTESRALPVEGRNHCGLSVPAVTWNDSQKALSVRSDTHADKR